MRYYLGCISIIELVQSSQNAVAMQKLVEFCITVIPSAIEHAICDATNRTRGLALYLKDILQLYLFKNQFSNLQEEPENFLVQ